VPVAIPSSTFASFSRERGMHGMFTRMLLYQLFEEAGGDKAEAACRAGVSAARCSAGSTLGQLDPSLETIRGSLWVVWSVADEP
jgi:hypothetical protein